MAFWVKEDVAGLEIAVDEFARMHVFECLYQLVDDEFLMDFLEDACADDHMQVYLKGLVPVSM